MSVMEDKEAEVKKTSEEEGVTEEAPQQESEKTTDAAEKSPPGRKRGGTGGGRSGRKQTDKKEEVEAGAVEEVKEEEASVGAEAEGGSSDQPEEDKKKTTSRKGRGKKKEEKTEVEGAGEEHGEEKAVKEEAPEEKVETVKEEKTEEIKGRGRKKTRKKEPEEKEEPPRTGEKGDKSEGPEEPEEELKAAPPVIEEPGTKIPKEFYLVFGKYPIEEVVVRDVGLAKYIILKPTLVHHTHGRHANRAFQKANLTIVERLINNMMRTEKYTGKKSKAYKVVKETFEIIEKRTKKNPLQVLADALVNSAPREEVTRLKFGGISVPKAVDVSPSRRLDIALRNICKGAVKMTFKNRKPVAECLATEIILASQEDVNSYAISKKEEVERIAASAR